MTEVRALVEGQFLSLRLHARRIGLQPVQLLATGGASANRAVIRIIADIFGVPVFTADVTDTASLGGAYRAMHGWQCEEAGRFVSFAEVMAVAPPFSLAAKPDTAAHEVYTNMLERYEALERKVIGMA